MKILLTGANGYIGTRLLPLLLEKGHEVYALVRSNKRLQIPPGFEKQVHVIQADLLDAESLEKIPDAIDAAYYLVHSMSASVKQFALLEAQSAIHFRDRLSRTRARQIIYLSAIANEEHLSHHLASRKNVETILRKGKVPVTTLMAGIIIGAGSASFEIIRDLVEKLPIMVAPKWTKNLTQPLAIRDVLDYLILVLDHPDCIGKRFEIGGPDVLSYKDLLLEFARIRHLKRWIITVPVLTPRLSSYWLYFITSASFPLAQSLVESLRNNAICKESTIQKIFPKELLDVKTAVRRSLNCTEEDSISSGWKGTGEHSNLHSNLSSYQQVPHFVIGISGIAGAGKSTLMRKLEKSLHATSLFWDDYDEISQGPEDYVKWYESSKNYDDWVYDDLVDTLEKLKEGWTVICPATKRKLVPTDYILFDAPLGYCHKATGKYIDFLVCLDTPLDIALARRLLRDYRDHPEPRKMLGELNEYLSRSRPLFILTPEEKICDLIIDGSLSIEEQERKVLSILKEIRKPRETFAIDIKPGRV